MTQFSRKTQFSLSNIVAAGHSPVIHSMIISDTAGDIVAGSPLLITVDGADLWDGTAGAPVSGTADLVTGAVTGEATPTVFGIALNTPMDGDGSVLVLLHGSYRMEAVTIAGVGLTQAQAFTLMSAGLYPEDSWGV